MNQKARVKLTVLEEFIGDLHTHGHKKKHCTSCSLLCKCLLFSVATCVACVYLLFFMKWQLGCYSIITGGLVFFTVQFSH